MLISDYLFFSGVFGSFGIVTVLLSKLVSLNVLTFVIEGFDAEFLRVDVIHTSTWRVPRLNPVFVRSATFQSSLHRFLRRQFRQSYII